MELNENEIKETNGYCYFEYECLILYDYFVYIEQYYQQQWNTNENRNKYFSKINFLSNNCILIIFIIVLQCK